MPFIFRFQAFIKVIKLIYFELIFRQGEREPSNFVILNMDIQFSQYHLHEEAAFFSTIYFWQLCKKGGGKMTIVVSKFIFGLFVLFHQLFIYICTSTILVLQHGSIV